MPNTEGVRFVKIKIQNIHFPLSSFEEGYLFLLNNKPFPNEKPLAARYLFVYYWCFMLSVVVENGGK